MTSSAQAHSQQQKLPRRQQRQRQASLAPPLVEFDWRGAALGLILMGLLTAIGPFTLLLAWLTWRWCTRSVFDGQDRWNSVGVFAWLFTPLPLLAITAFFVQPTLALHLWSVSPLHLLGVPDLLNNMGLRWLGSLPATFGYYAIDDTMLEPGDRDLEDGVPEAVSLRRRIALDEPLPLEGREQSPGRAPVESTRVCELEDGGRTRGVRQRLQKRDRTLDGLNRALPFGQAVHDVDEHRTMRP